MATVATPQPVSPPFRGQPLPGQALPGQAPRGQTPGGPANAVSGLPAPAFGAGSHPVQSRPATAAPEAAHAATSSSLAPAGAMQMAANASEQLADDAEESLAFPPRFAGLPVGLSVSVPVRAFRVRNLLTLVLGEIIETQWGHGEDLPLASGEVQLAWTEFEVVDTKLAVRVTRLI